jgi:hypothetical protein
VDGVAGHIAVLNFGWGGVESCHFHCVSSRSPSRSGGGTSLMCIDVLWQVN